MLGYYSQEPLTFCNIYQTCHTCSKLL